MYQNIYYDRDDYSIHLWDDKKGYMHFPYQRYAYIVDEENGEYLTLDNKHVSRITKWKKEDLTSGKYYEADVDPLMRILIDNYYETDDVSVDINTLFFDIETEILQGFPNKDNPINKITSIAFYNTATESYFVLILDPENKIEDQKKEYEGKELFILSYTEEDVLLKAFLSFLHEFQPHILTGWNIEFFDIPYLYNRIKVLLGQDYANMLSPIGKIEYSEGLKRYMIGGVSILDYMSLYKKNMPGERPTYRLDYIGTLEVNRGKIEYEGNLDNLYKTDINKFLDYNLNDVVIVKMLDDKFKFIDLTRTVAHTCHVPYEYVFANTKFLEGALLTILKRLDIIAPCKPQTLFPDKEHKKIMGAFVKAPIPGAYKWLIDLDATSLYPSIIRTLNISPETKLGKILKVGNTKVDIISLEHLRNVCNKDGNTPVSITNGHKAITIPITEVVSMLEDNSMGMSAFGVIYSQESRGIIPLVLDDWFQKRVEMKDKRDEYKKGTPEYSFYDKRQYVQKILLNSLYGVLSQPSFRFYDPDNGESVTRTGQELIKFAESIVNKYINDKTKTQDRSVIYIDTDSLFIRLDRILESEGVLESDDNQIVKRIHELIKELQYEVNSKLGLFSSKNLGLENHVFQFKQEYILRRGVWIAKKRYASHIINKEGQAIDELDVKGMDVVRSNYPEAFKEFLKSVLLALLSDATKGTIDNMIAEFKDVVRKLPISEIMNSTSVQNIDKYVIDSVTSELNDTEKGTPVHSKAAICYNNLISHYKLHVNYDYIHEGEKIKWAYLLPNPFRIDQIALKGDGDPAEIVEFVEKYIDRETIFTKAVGDKIQAIYDAVKWGTITDNKYVHKFFEF